MRCMAHGAAYSGLYRRVVFIYKTGFMHICMTLCILPKMALDLMQQSVYIHANCKGRSGYDHHAIACMMTVTYTQCVLAMYTVQGINFAIRILELMIVNH